MKYLKILILFFFITIDCYSQKNNNLSVEFNNINAKQAIEKIESISDYKFYFEENWIENIIITKKFEQEKIETILKSIFQDTNLNFFIDNNKIILTQNIYIQNKLPENFFNTKNTTTSETSIINKFQNDENLTLIGKETGEIKNLDTYILSGKIKNLKNNSPIANATIKIINKTISTTTNENGVFSINVPYGENTIEVDAQGFIKTSKKVIVFSDGKLDFDLSEKINQLKEVVVKGKRNKVARTAITGVTTLEAEGIKSIPVVFGERDILKAALTIPGIKTAGEGSAGFNVRGGKEDQNLILLDNATIYNPAHFFGFFSALNPYTTNKIDIYKGGIPSYFGGRLSSVFDISSKNGNLEKISGEGGIGPVTSNISISAPIIKNKASLLIGGRGTYSDWILKNLKNERLKKSQASFYDLIAKYKHIINKNNDLEATVYFSNDKYSLSSDSLFNYKNRAASISWKHNFNEKLKSDLNISTSDYEFNVDYNPQENMKSFNFNFKISESQATLKLNHTLNEKHKLIYGISTKLYNINPGSFTPINNESNLKKIEIQKEKGLESSAFITDNYKVTNKLMVDIGLRYSTFIPLGSSTQRIYEAGLPLSESTLIGEKNFGQNETIKTFTGLEPRIAFKYNFNDKLYMKAGYDKSFQYIHLLSNNTTQSPTDTWKLSDLNVKPQSGEQFSLGMFKNLDYQDLELSVEGYYKKSQNVLDYKVGSNLILNEKLETVLLQGEGKSYGVEVLIKKQTGKLNGWIGYTYSRSLLKLDSEFNDEKVNNGEYFASNFDKPHDFSAVLNYKFTKRYSFSANFIYQTGRPITYPIGKYTFANAEYTLYSDRNKFRIPDYYRLDIGLNIEGNHKIKKLAHSFWNISIYNVLGRNNPYSIFFITSEGQVKGYKTSIFNIPIPTITYNFKF